MITESTTQAVPLEVSQTIDTLRQEVDTLKHELAQALDVWQTTLAAEKKKFEELLEYKDLASQDQESQWARQSAAYEERLAAMKSEFEARLAQAEQNAARALTEFDDAWQRDKLEWGPAGQNAWPAQRQEFEQKIASLEQEVEQLRSERDTQAAAPSPETVKSLQNQLLEFQQTVTALQSQASQSDNLVNACIQALDYQISVLYDLVHHFTAPAPATESNLAQS